MGGLPKGRYTLIGPDGQPFESPTPGSLGGHSGWRVYGRLDCPMALKKLASDPDYVRHRVFFPDQATAVAAGYEACRYCTPQVVNPPEVP
jgi:hypothetical protein